MAPGKLDRKVANAAAYVSGVELPVDGGRSA